jgi:hypothetical protein
MGSATTFNNGETGLLGSGLPAFNLTEPLSFFGGLLGKTAAWSSTKDLAAALAPGADTVGNFQDLAQANGSYRPTTQSMLSAEAKATDPPMTDLYAAYLAAFNAAPDAATKVALGNQYAAALASQPTPQHKYPRDDENAAEDGQREDRKER